MPQKDILSQKELDGNLIEACLEGNLQLVRYWLTSPEVKRIHGRNAHIEAITFSTKFGCDLTPLMAACCVGKLEVVKYLLTSLEIIQAGGKHADIEAGYGLALVLAAMNGQLEVVQYLLTSPEIIQAGGMHADIYDDCQAFHYACESCHWDVAKYMLTSPEIIEAGGKHASIETNLLDSKENNYLSALEAICQNNNHDFIHFLVFDYFLERTAAVARITEQYPEIDKLFYVRDDHYGLSHRLDEKDAGKKTKI